MEVVVDAGHGGNDSGVIANGIVEKDYTLKISNYQYDRFKKLGIPVARTRSVDETLSPEERIKRVLSAFGNKPSVIVLSNHLSSGGGEIKCVSTDKYNNFRQKIQIILTI